MSACCGAKGGDGVFLSGMGGIILQHSFGRVFEMRCGIPSLRSGHNGCAALYLLIFSLI